MAAMARPARREWRNNDMAFLMLAVASGGIGVRPARGISWPSGAIATFPSAKVLPAKACCRARYRSKFETRAPSLRVPRRNPAIGVPHGEAHNCTCQLTFLSLARAKRAD